MLAELDNEADGIGIVERGAGGATSVVMCCSAAKQSTRLIPTGWRCVSVCALAGCQRKPQSCTIVPHPAPIMTHTT